PRPAPACHPAHHSHPLPTRRSSDLKMFANQQNILRPDLEKYAGEIGLDVGKFKSALDSGAGKAKVQQDLAAATQIGVQGTPNFRSEEHTSELQSPDHLVCRLLLEKK